MKGALDTCGAAVVQRLEQESAPMAEELGFPGLRGVFRGEFRLTPPLLPKVRFAVDIANWSRIVERPGYETVWVEKRIWWTLWIAKKTVQERRPVIVKTTETGISVGKLGDLLEGFTSSGSVDDLEEVFAAWLGESIARFDVALESRLNEGVKTYRGAFEERMDQLESGARSKIEDHDRHRDSVGRLVRELEQARDWRSYA